MFPQIWMRTKKEYPIQTPLQIIMMFHFNGSPTVKSYLTKKKINISFNNIKKFENK